ncbi:MAG: site-specific DNA-methyltransferase [Candidatus Aenigmatarchaeota archaeon]
MPKNYSDWSKDELVRELKKAEKRKKYGIVWEDKPEVVAERCKNELPVLAEDKNKKIVTDKNKPNNILIEGDNYHALSVLNYTHKGKIDIIYIDPPYNTGNGEGFIYNDKIVDREDSFRHSKWISFMNKRLKLSKNLLKKNGVIFISIDDNEIAQLRLLCDDIFGEENFAGIICWKHRHSISNDLLISQNHNFILLYAKSFKSLFNNRKNFRLEKDFLGFSNPDKDSNGPYKLTPVDGPGGARKGNPHYEFLGINGYWRYSKETMQELYDKGQIIKRGKTLARKYYLKDAKENGGKVVTTWWDDVGTTTEGTRTLNDMIGEGKFNNPKPVSLLRRVVQLASDKQGTILDFFAGSGTTAHAVLDMNKEDGGKRKFILCTNNENDICTEVCYPRVKKVIQNLEKESKNKLVKNMPGNLKYFKTDFVDAEPTDKNKRKMVEKSTEMLCLREDCFDEVMQGHNFRIFTNSQGKNLGIIYDDDGIEPFKKEAKKLKKDFIVYVFSLDESVREEEFEDVKKLVELKPIPAVILNVYKRIFK